MREIRQSGSEGGEVMSLPDPYMLGYKQDLQSYTPMPRPTMRLV